MSAPKCFEELEAWLAARELTNRIYAVCREGALARDFGLRDQVQRAAVSVMSNIAEGFESRHVAEKQQAYNYARRSCGEVRSLSYVLGDNGYVTTDEQREILAMCIRAGKLVSGLMRSLKHRIDPHPE